MTSETQPDTYSDYTWVAGVNDRYDSIGVVQRSSQDGVDLLLRGYARKKRQGLGHGTIRAHFDHEAIESLRDRLTAILEA